MRRLIFALLLVACSPTYEPPNDPIYRPLPSDAELPPVTEDCERACARMTELGCPEAEPLPGPDGVVGTADDTACAVWLCNADFEDPRAIAGIKSCAELE